MAIPQTVETTGNLPASIIDALDAYAKLSHGAYSPQTVKAIQSDTRLFSEWCAGAGVDAGPPVSPESVAAFIDAMSATRKPATIQRYVSSLDHLNRAVGCDPVRRSNPVALALRRMGRKLDAVQDQARGMRRAAVDRALAGLSDSLLDLRDAALISLAYDTLARASELVAFNVSDIIQDVDGTRARIRRSKTDQTGKGHERFIGPDTFAAVAAWVAAAGLEVSDPLFLPLSNSAKADRLTSKEVTRIYKRRVGEAYSAHSTRVGAAQDQRAAGLPSGLIAQAGGWKSEKMVNHYTQGIAVKESGAARLAAMQGRV